MTSNTSAAVQFAPSHPSFMQPMNNEDPDTREEEVQDDVNSLATLSVPSMSFESHDLREDAETKELFESIAKIEFEHENDHEEPATSPSLPTCPSSNPIHDQEQSDTHHDPFTAFLDSLTPADVDFMDADDYSIDVDGLESLFGHSLAAGSQVETDDVLYEVPDSIECHTDSPRQAEGDEFGFAVSKFVSQKATLPVPLDTTFTNESVRGLNVFQNASIPTEDRRQTKRRREVTAGSSDDSDHDCQGQSKKARYSPTIVLIDDHEDDDTDKKKAESDIVGPNSKQMMVIHQMVAYLGVTDDKEARQYLNEFQQVITECTDYHETGRYEYRHLPGAIFQEMVDRIGGPLFLRIYKEAKTFQHPLLERLRRQDDAMVSDVTIDYPSVVQVAIAYGFYLAKNQHTNLNQDGFNGNSNFSATIKDATHTISTMTAEDRLSFWNRHACQ